MYCEIGMTYWLERAEAEMGESDPYPRLRRLQAAEAGGPLNVSALGG